MHLKALFIVLSLTNATYEGKYYCNTLQEIRLALDT